LHSERAYRVPFRESLDSFGDQRDAHLAVGEIACGDPNPHALGTIDAAG